VLIMQSLTTREKNSTIRSLRILWGKGGERVRGGKRESGQWSTGISGRKALGGVLGKGNDWFAQSWKQEEKWGWNIMIIKSAKE